MIPNPLKDPTTPPAEPMTHKASEAATQIPSHSHTMTLRALDGLVMMDGGLDKNEPDAAPDEHELEVASTSHANHVGQTLNI